MGKWEVLEVSELDLTKYEGHSPVDWSSEERRLTPEEESANIALMLDAPLLLAEVRRLDLEHKAAERELLWVRQSHARLLAALKCMCACYDQPLGTRYEECARDDARRAVAEAEALNG